MTAALRASIQSAKGKKHPQRSVARSRNGGSADGDLAKSSKGELEERSRKAKISARSTTSKQRLVEALRDRQAP